MEVQPSSKTSSHPCMALRLIIASVALSYPHLTSLEFDSNPPMKICGAISIAHRTGLKTSGYSRYIGQALWSIGYSARSSYVLVSSYFLIAWLANMLGDMRSKYFAILDIDLCTDDSIQDIMSLVSRMVLLANKHHHQLHIINEGWTARPVSVQLRQTNGFDCGLWVLAGVAAVLQGYHVTGFAESDMPTIRNYIATLVCTLPQL
jgi:hypothetical protein